MDYNYSPKYDKYDEQRKSEKAKLIEYHNKFLNNHRWLSTWDLDCKCVGYSRKPTKAEISAGYGATHYRDFPLKEVVGNNGQIKKRLFAKDEAVWYSLG